MSLIYTGDSGSVSVSKIHTYIPDYTVRNRNAGNLKAV
jgi:hypothetical protein